MSSFQLYLGSLLIYLSNQCNFIIRLAWPHVAAYLLVIRKPCFIVPPMSAGKSSNTSSLSGSSGVGRPSPQRKTSRLCGYGCRRIHRIQLFKLCSRPSQDFAYGCKLDNTNNSPDYFLPLPPPPPPRLRFTSACCDPEAPGMTSLYCVVEPR